MTNNYGLIIEIDSEENKYLLDDLTRMLFTRKLGQRRAEKKLDLKICLLKF